jgi:hypothetical protein
MCDELSCFHVLTHLIISTTLRDKHHYFSPILTITTSFHKVTLLSMKLELKPRDPGFWALGKEKIETNRLREK